MICDVKGCNEEATSGGWSWRETGYWALYTKHNTDGKNGLPQPEMKQVVERVVIEE